jgi:anti-sigma B factor antagonist
MNIDVSEATPFRVIRLAGDVDLHSSPQARQAILDELKRGMPLLIDLSAVSYMDSSGVASLVEGYQTARKQGIEFGLAAPATAALNVLKLARLDKVFPIHASVAERLTRGD